MSTIETRTLQSLDAAERDAIESAMRTNSEAWLADNHDIVVVWLLLIFAGLGLCGVAVFGGLPLPVPKQLLVIPGLALAGWGAYLWVSTHGKRGMVFTRTATWLVRGSKLRGLRHDQVWEIRRRLLRRRSGSFTVLELRVDERTKLTLYTHGRWADPAIAAIQRGAGKVVRVSGG
jgi:hypothetical protein